MKRLYKKPKRGESAREKYFADIERLQSIPAGCNVTLPAMREARLISEGKIPSKSFNSVDDLLKDLIA